MPRDPLTQQLETTRAVLVAAIASIDLQLLALAGPEPEEGPPPCPRCHGREAAAAGRSPDGKPEFVCPCGANFTEA